MQAKKLLFQGNRMCGFASGAGILPASAAAVPAAETTHSEGETPSALAGVTPAPLYMRSPWLLFHHLHPHGKR